MTKTYVPESLIFRGVEYQGEQFHDVPNELANLISQHPQWSKAKPPKKALGNPYAHYNTLSLEDINAALRVYEDELEAILHNIKIIQTMDAGSSRITALVNTYKRLQSEYLEVKTATAPMIKTKQIDQERKRASLERWAASLGGKINFSSAGAPSMHIPKNSVVISGGN